MCTATRWWRRCGSQGRQRGSETKTFGTDTAELVELGDWLISHLVTRVGLESTGVYGKPVFYLLEDRIEQVCRELAEPD